MTERHEQELYEKYPGLFRERTLDQTQTCMCWGIEAADGWFRLLDGMCRELAALEKEYGVDIVFRQVKSKYGSLRAYHTVRLGPLWEKPLRDTDAWILTRETGSGGRITVPHTAVFSLVDQTIDTFESFSHRVCEDCGQLGAAHEVINGWVYSVCPDCAKRVAGGRKLE